MNMKDLADHMRSRFNALERERMGLAVFLEWRA